MGATIPTQQKENTFEKLVKLMEGKGYLEILMYLLAISSSVVILFG